MRKNRGDNRPAKPRIFSRHRIKHFNKTVPVGTPVSVVREADGKTLETTTTTTARTGKTGPVVKVEGIPWPVNLSLVVVLPHEAKEGAA